MSSITKNRISKTLTLLLAVMAPLMTVADDTEIYLASQGNGDSRSAFEPNILFILDTSDSMKGGEIGAYDPDIDYIQELDDLGITHTCERGKIYRQSNDQTGDEVPGKSCDQYFFYEAQFQCREAYDVNQALSLAKNGYWYGIVQQYDTTESPPDWENLISGDVEEGFTYACLSESGRINDDGVPEYMAEGPTSGFSTNASDEITLAGDDYTIFSANYLAWRNDYSRIKVLNKVMHQTLDDLVVGNVGLMMFDYKTGSGDSTDGGMVIHEVDHISTARASLKTTIDSYITYAELEGRGSSSSSPTPLSETYWEAYRYYKGLDWDYGDTSSPIPSVLESRVSGGSQYATPIQKACQKNYIVYLTDGEPTADNGRDDEMNALFASSGLLDDDGLTPTCDFNSDNTGDNCLDEFALYLNNTDLLPGLGSDEEEKQSVITHVVGFGIDNDLIKDTARKGGGRYFNANSADQLTTAFRTILRDVTSDAGSFTAPAVSVNAFSRLMHRDDLYFTVFKPSTNSRWDGNLKKYKLRKNLNGQLEIVDANLQPAVNPVNGQFRQNTRSFWTPAGLLDGDDIAKGGAASQLQLDIPFTGVTRARTALSSTSPGNNLYGTATNAVHESNNGTLTKSVLGIPTASDTEHQDLLKWVRGVDIKDYDNDNDVSETRLQMGDPLHTQPVVVTYGGTDDNPDVTVFVTTNDGFLHAFDAETGQEQIAYIPAELLDKPRYGYDEGLSSGKLYGLDGGISAWVNDVDMDNAISAMDGDFVRLFMGMRRGGHNYYALDVTERAYPALKWDIKQTETGFNYLGQTWSKPTLATIKYEGNPRKVLIFGGGFDDGGSDSYSEDDTVSPPNHDIGNAIFIVDATTGDLLYTASGHSSLAVPSTATHEYFPGMDFAIPSDLAVLDINTDGYHDRIYVGDLGGQLWRFDIRTEGVGDTNRGELVDGAIIAKLGRTASGAGTEDNRRFFYKPDVALIADEQLGTFLSVSIGSGRRNKPTDGNIQDRFHSIWDLDVYTKPETYRSPVEPADLYDATDNLIQGTLNEQTAAQADINRKNGWFIDLEKGSGGKGEKSLSSSITLDNRVMFTTYEPPGSSDPQSCEAGTGSGHFYIVNVSNATPVRDTNTDGDELDAADRSTELARAGIPPSPVVLFPEANGGEAAILVGSEIQPADLKQRTRKTYWYVKDSQ